jgi:hypothetical protein
LRILPFEKNSSFFLSSTSLSIFMWAGHIFCNILLDRLSHFCHPSGLCVVLFGLYERGVRKDLKR